MSKSFKYLMKQAELAKVAKVAKPEAENAKTAGGEGVAAEPGALKFQLVNSAKKNLETSSPQVVAPVSPDSSLAQSVQPEPANNPVEAPPVPVEPTVSASAPLDTPLAPNSLESQAIARSEALEGKSVDMVSGGQSPGQGAGHGGEDSPNGGIKALKAEESEGIRARVYGRPLNPRMRLIEFVGGPRSGQHAQLWVKADAQIMLNWVVWVKPDVNRPNPPGLHWVMDGAYNWRGIRIK